MSKNIYEQITGFVIINEKEEVGKYIALKNIPCINMVFISFDYGLKRNKTYVNTSETEYSITAKCSKVIKKEIESLIQCLNEIDEENIKSIEKWIIVEYASCRKRYFEYSSKVDNIVKLAKDIKNKNNIDYEVTSNPYLIYNKKSDIDDAYMYCLVNDLLNKKLYKEIIKLFTDDCSCSINFYETKINLHDKIEIERYYKKISGILNYNIKKYNCYSLLYGLLDSLNNSKIVLLVNLVDKKSNIEFIVELEGKKDKIKKVMIYNKQASNNRMKYLDQNDVHDIYIGIKNDFKFERKKSDTKIIF